LTFLYRIHVLIHGYKDMAGDSRTRKLKLASFFTIILFIFFGVYFTQSVLAQVVINEFSSFDNPGDWVEIYNFGPGPIDLSEYRLRDSSATQKVDLTGDLNQGEFFVADLKDYLNKTGDIIKLIHLTNDIEDTSPLMTICYGDKKDECERIKVGCYPLQNQSVGSYPSDGGNTFERFSPDTHGSTNTIASLDPCPTPTPEPTNIPTPTPKPMSTSTPTPTPSPTKKPTLTPTKMATPKTAKEPDEEGLIGESGKSDNTLGVKDVTDEEEISTQDEIGEEDSKKFPVFAGIFVVLGIGLIGGSLYTFFRKQKRGYNLGSEKQ